MAIMNELRQYVRSRLIRGAKLLLLFELLAQGQGLELELFGQRFPHGCGHSILDDLGGTTTPLCPDLQQVVGDALLSYR